MTHQIFLPILLALCALTDANAVAGSDYTLPEISYTDLRLSFQDAGGAATIREALTGDGILAITGVPRLSAARRVALSAAGDCLAHFPPADSTTEESKEGYTVRRLPDGSERRTFGAELVGSQGFGRDHLPSALLQQCDGLEEATETLRDVVDKAAYVLSAALDDVLLGADNTAFFYDQAYQQRLGKDGKGRSWGSFDDLVRGGDQLEHFHSYAYEGGEPKGESGKLALDMHTDAGLFILFVPALYSDDLFDKSAPEDFFFLDRAGRQHGLVVRAGPGVGTGTVGTVGTVAVTPDTLVLMVGQAAEQYLNPVLKTHSTVELRAVPHALSLRSLDTETSKRRSWYGRMFLPPRDAWLANMTYAEARKRLVQGAGESNHGDTLPLLAGCGVGQSDQIDQSESPLSQTYLPLVQSRMLEDCPSGTVYCWMNCLSYASFNLTCPTSEITCVDSSGDPTDPGIQDTTNHPGCPGDVYADPGGFCQGVGTTMYMQGFVSYLSGSYASTGYETPQCLSLWFEDWVLNSAGKFAAACFGCLLLGLLTESVTWLRRLARAHLKNKPALRQGAVMVFLYAAQLTLGYFAMLVAMTYQSELFICIVLGLAMGHWVFNFRPSFSMDDAVKSEVEDMGVDPCCAYIHLESEEEGRTQSGTAQRRGRGVNDTTNLLHM
mmetsp:Transcript_12650/g.28080  ORF Transcript_12650/g.28080 Transcript_12650/m.28080 type:complete len:664 (+) Transcript_12650:137-2128(+)